MKKGSRLTNITRSFTFSHILWLSSEDGVVFYLHCLQERTPSSEEGPDMWLKAQEQTSLTGSWIMKKRHDMLRLHYSSVSQLNLYTHTVTMSWNYCEHLTLFLNLRLSCHRSSLPLCSQEAAVRFTSWLLDRIRCSTGSEWTCYSLGSTADACHYSGVCEVMRFHIRADTYSNTYPWIHYPSLSSSAANKFVNVSMDGFTVTTEAWSSTFSATGSQTSGSSARRSFRSPVASVRWKALDW